MDEFELREPTLADIKEFEEDDELLNVLEYKGKSYPIFKDDYGAQCYTVIAGQYYGGGAFNSNYLDDFKYLLKKIIG